MAGIENALVTGIAVGGGHHSLDDAQRLIQHLYQRRHAIGGAAGVADDVVIFMAILIGIHAYHEGTNAFALAGCSNQYLTCASFDMLTGALLVDENTSGFDHQINAPFFPGQVEGIAIGETLDVFTIHNDRIVGIAHLRIADAAQHRVVLEQVGVGARI